MQQPIRHADPRRRDRARNSRRNAGRAGGARAPFQWDTQIAGLRGGQVRRRPSAAKTIDSIRRTRLALEGPLETPSAGGYARRTTPVGRNSSCMQTCVRHARSFRAARFENIDLVVVRENLEGLYIGHDIIFRSRRSPCGRQWHGRQHASGSRRLLDFAFSHAGRHRPQESVHRAQGQYHKALTGIFLEDRLGTVRAKVQGQVHPGYGIIDAAP